MKFPSEILPNSNRKFIECDLSRFVLIRHTNSTDVNEIFDPVTGFIKEKHICDPSEHVNDLSTNLFGIFKLKHLFIQLTTEGKRKYGDYCAPSIKVRKPTLYKDFTINNNRHYWVIKIGDIQNTIAVYKRSNLDCKAICVVEHSPMLWNFWHFSVRWKTDEGFWHKLPDTQKKNLSRRLRHDARAHIKMFAKLEEPYNPKLKRSCYEKKTHTILKIGIVALAFYSVKKILGKLKK